MRRVAECRNCVRQTGHNPDAHEGVSGRIAMGGVTKVEPPVDAVTVAIWYNLV